MATLQTADRVLEALFHLADVEEAGPSELARRLQVSKATACNLLRTLEKHDLAATNPATHRYRLGPGVFRLTHRASPTLDLRIAARPHMEQLRDLTGETVTLHLRVGWERVCIERFESHHALRRSANVGERWPLHSGGTGWTLLAWEPEATIERFLATAPFRTITPTTPIDARTVRAALDQTRAQGYAITSDDPIPGVSAVCVPVWNREGHVAAALSVSGPLSRWSAAEMQRHLPAILDAARMISAALGYRAHAPVERPRVVGVEKPAAATSSRRRSRAAPAPV